VQGSSRKAEDLHHQRTQREQRKLCVLRDLCGARKFQESRRPSPERTQRAQK
jgi:hypothetical protein